jgi:hypothetical protein
MISFITGRLLDLSPVALEAFELGRMGLLYLVLHAGTVTGHTDRGIIDTRMKTVIGDAGIFLAGKKQEDPDNDQNKDYETQDASHA